MRWICLLGVICLFSSCHRHRPRVKVFPSGRPTPEVVLQTWLAKSCGVGELGDLEEEMRRLGDGLTEQLIAAFEDKPTLADKGVVAEYEREALRRMKRELDSLGSGEEEKLRVRNRVETEHVDQAVARYVRNYKSAVLSGLGVVGTPKARLYLEQVKANRESAFQGNAGVILRAPAPRRR